MRGKRRVSAGERLRKPSFLVLGVLPGVKHAARGLLDVRGSVARRLNGINLGQVGLLDVLEFLLLGVLYRVVQGAIRMPVSVVGGVLVASGWGSLVSVASAVAISVMPAWV